MGYTLSLFDEISSNSKLGFVKGTDSIWNVETVPCGIPPVDHILGGGAAFGRIMEMFGNEASGKTFLLYLFLIENIRRGGVSVLLESEGAFNPDFYTALGGNPDRLLVRPVSSVEKVFDQVKDICKLKKKSKNSDEKIIIGWDSLAATGTDHLEETGMDTVDMSKPRMMSQGFTLVSTPLLEAGISFIIINQLRAKIDKYNPGVLTPGGMATGFAASQRLSLSYTQSKEFKIYHIPEDATEEEKKKKDWQQIGRVVECKVAKNKIAGAWLQCNLHFYSHEGYEHPCFEGKTTRMGLDIDESLLDYYKTGNFKLSNGDRPVIQSSPGWFVLSSALDPKQSKWRRKDWPALLASRPDLQSLLYGGGAAVHLPPPVPVDESGVGGDEE